MHFTLYQFVLKVEWLKSLSWERVRVKLKFVFLLVAPEMKPSTFPWGPWLWGPCLGSELGERVGSDQFLEDE